MIKQIMMLSGIRTAVVGIIRKGNKVLLTKRSVFLADGGKWCLPGGHVKKWETGEKAVIREIKEEIGCRVKKARFLFYHEEFVRRLNLHALVLVFSLEIGGRKKPNWEVSKVEWFDRREINKLDLAFSHKEILNKYFDKDFKRK